MEKTEPEMRRIVRYVKYEWDRFSWAADRIKHSVLDGKEPDNWEAGTGSPDHTTNSLIEVCLLHARALRDFLGRKRPKRKDPMSFEESDVFAGDFFDDPRDWKPPALDYLLHSENRKRLNKSLAHLTYERADYETSGRDWDFRAIFDEITAAWKDFLEALPAERRGWFEQVSDE